MAASKERITEIDMPLTVEWVPSVGQADTRIDLPQDGNSEVRRGQCKSHLAPCDQHL